MLDEHGNVPDRAALLRQAQGYAAAGRTLNGWVAGAQALGLLRGALAAGVFDAARDPRTAAQLAAATGGELRQVEYLCEALVAHGVFARSGAAYHLAPDFAVLAAPTAPQRLPDLLGGADVMERQLAATSQPGTYDLSAEDALALAQGAAPDPVSPLRQALVADFFDALPELRAAWAAGAQHIEFGCGIGASLLGALTAQPNLTAVGVERVAAVAAETRRRAAEAGVADRVEVRCADALDTPEVGVFDSAMWAQQFFPVATRAPMLAVAHRALRPGGVLLVPSFVPGEPPDSDAALREPAGQFYTLLRLLCDSWGVPALTAEALRAEVEAAGFAYLRRTWTGRNYWLLFRRAGGPDTPPSQR